MDNDNESAPGGHAQDIALVQKVLAKDRAAFDLFFNAYFPRLFRFASTRLDEPALCEDIVQETLIKAVNGLAQYRGEASLFTWLCQICRNQISNYMRKDGVKLEKQLSLDDSPQIRAVLESMSVMEPDSADTLSVRRQVHLTLDYLPEKYGRALEWKYVEGLSVQEIAERMQVTVVVVQSLLARARRAFREGFVDMHSELRTSE